MGDPTGRISHLPDFHRGVSWKQPVRCATTANVTIATALNAGDAIDGITLAAGDRVLVKDQTAGAENGIYVAGASPARAFDMDQDTTDATAQAEEVLGAFVYVIEGTANGGTLWRATNTSAPTLGTTALAFSAWTPADAHLVDTVDAHDASAISVLDAGGYFAGTDVEAALAELGAGSAPAAADYLVGTAHAGLSAEIVVGTTPGGELGGTWASPTVDAVHSGSAHHAQSHDHSAAGDGTALAPATVAISSTGAAALTIGGDVNLYRSAPNVLKTDDDLEVGGGDINLGSQLALSEDSAARFSVSSRGATEPRGAIAMSLGHASLAYGWFVWNSGDAQPRASLGKDVSGNPAIQFGNGTAGVDVNLYRGTANRLDLASGDSLNLVSGNLMVAATNVVGTRKTGWGAPTGTATRTTFATTTVTLAQLAERVKALIDDLTTHGLIGA